MKHQRLAEFRYECTDLRWNCANGHKPRRVCRPAGTVREQVLNNEGHEKEPFLLDPLLRDLRPTRAVMLAAAEVSIQGLFISDVEGVMRKFSNKGFSAAQISRGTARLNAELGSRRQCPLGETPNILSQLALRDEATGRQRAEDRRGDSAGRDLPATRCLDAAFGDGGVLAHLLGVTRRPWHAKRAVQVLNPDDHTGLHQAVSGMRWVWGRRGNNGANVPPNLKCPVQGTKSTDPAVHLQSATSRAGSPTQRWPKPRSVYSSPSNARRFAAWLEGNTPDGLAVLTMPDSLHHWVRTTNLIEQAVKREIEQYTVRVRVLPNEAVPDRPVMVVSIRIDEGWTTVDRKYINWECQND